MLLLASPFFLFGAVLAFYMTSGKSTATNMSFVGRLYRYEFESFTTLTLPEPSFDFFRIDVVAGLKYTAKAFMDVFVDPDPLGTEPLGAGQTAAGLDGLTLVLSFLKILVALLAVILSKLDSSLVEELEVSTTSRGARQSKRLIILVDEALEDRRRRRRAKSHTAWYVDLIAERRSTRIAYPRGPPKACTNKKGRALIQSVLRPSSPKDVAAYRDAAEAEEQYKSNDLRDSSVRRCASNHRQVVLVRG